jgi:sugar phosphate isomerase/epimerase
MVIGNPMIFLKSPLEEALRSMVKFEFDAVELWPPQIEVCKTDELRKQLAEHISSLGLSLVGLNSAAPPYFEALESPDDVEGIVQGLKQDVDIAASMGMNQLLSWDGRRLESMTDSDLHGWVLDETVNIFREAVSYAETKGITITVEIHPYTVGIDVDFACKLYDRIDSPFFGITYDSCHFAVGLPNGYIDAIPKLGHRINNVHFADSDKHSSELHFAPGTGCLDLDGIVAALKAIHYQGPMMLDLWLYPFPEEGSKIGMPYIRQVMKTLGYPSAA